MIIGFTERAQNVSETHVPGVDLFQLPPIKVSTVRMAGREHPMMFTILKYKSIAIVEPLISQDNPEFDAIFGSRDPTDGVIITKCTLQCRADTFIRRYNPEEEECFTTYKHIPC